MTKNSTCHSNAMFPQLGKIEILSSETPHKCPVCGGSGRVRSGFYERDVDYYSGSSGEMWTEMCRACQGTGILWR
jgi:hypothetical protein